MPEYQSTNGGCYTIYADIGTRHGNIELGRDSSSRYSNPGSRTCPACGRSVPAHYEDYSNSGGGEFWAWDCSGVSKYVYKASCGYTNGEVVSAKITY